MKTNDFFFDLPETLIAQNPPEKRGDSRLMVMDPKTEQITHTHIKELPEYLETGSIMVFNDSKVRKARMEAKKESGARVELIFLGPADEAKWKVLLSNAKKLKAGHVLILPGGTRAVIEEKNQDGTAILGFIDGVDSSFFENHGHIPLPPYIKRSDSSMDADRYQTIYGKETGSSAAPTAGLHFTNELFQKLDEKGIQRVFVTLHVGLGTFLPVRTEELTHHKMHSEDFYISPEASDFLTQSKNQGKRILAVGTTSLRTLEAAWTGEHFQSGHQSTNLFCYPGYQFKAVDGLFTNFHTPKSTLLALVCAFGGMDFTLNAYKEAVKEQYRFFSYGDATLFQNHP